MKNILITILTLVFSSLINAQVLYNENFDNYTLGNLGTDPTGVIPGQGGWLTAMYQNGNSSHVTITAEPNRGKVVTATSGMPPQQHNISIFKNGLNTLIDQRTPGNNVIKLEVDFYTGAQHTFNNPGMYQRIYLLYEEFDLSLTLKEIVAYTYSPAVGGIGVNYKDQMKYVS